MSWTLGEVSTGPLVGLETCGGDVIATAPLPASPPLDDPSGPVEPSVSAPSVSNEPSIAEALPELDAPSIPDPPLVPLAAIEASAFVEPEASEPDPDAPPPRSPPLSPASLPLPEEHAGMASPRATTMDAAMSLASMPHN
jgi:hypothetical protein